RWRISYMGRGDGAFRSVLPEDLPASGGTGSFFLADGNVAILSAAVPRGITRRDLIFLERDGYWCHEKESPDRSGDSQEAGEDLRLRRLFPGLPGQSGDVCSALGP